MSTSPSRRGMTLVELSVVLAILGGLGSLSLSQIMKLRMRIKAVEVKVLVREIAREFESHVTAQGLPLPEVAASVPLADYGQVAATRATQYPSPPKGESDTFDYWLGSGSDTWQLTVLEREKGPTGRIMTCGYQFPARGWVEVNPASPWAEYLGPACSVAASQ